MKSKLGPLTKKALKSDGGGLMLLVHLGLYYASMLEYGQKWLETTARTAEAALDALEKRLEESK